MSLRRVAVAALALALLPACSDDETPDTFDTEAVRTSAAPSRADARLLPGILEEAGIVTFRTALARAYLADSLQGKGPFTVFAPSDTAFMEMKAMTPQRLLAAGNRENLRALVAYHIVPGRLRAEDLMGTRTLVTYGGQRLVVEGTPGGVSLLGAGGSRARVTTPGILADNGLIHLIDGVLLPPAPGDSVTVPAPPPPPRTAPPDSTR